MASNPYVNKVVLADGTTLIDLTGDTVAAGSMLSGTTAHDASGAAISGNIQTKTSSDLTASGKTVTAPAGYYASPASKNVGDASGLYKDGGSIGGTVELSPINATLSSSNTSGISVTGLANAYSNPFNIYALTPGWFSGASFGGSSGSLPSVQKYLTGVSIQKPLSGTRQFAVTVPNGSGTITFTFNVDSSGNVTVTES